LHRAIMMPRKITGKSITREQVTSGISVNNQNQITMTKQTSKIIATDDGGGANFNPAPIGNHAARCVYLVHIGTEKDEFQGQEKHLNRVRITWELPNELAVFNSDAGEQPYLISQDYTLSLGEKANLRAMLQAWRGKPFTDDELKGFDITTIIGVPCLLNVIHKKSKAGKDFAAIAGVTPLPKGMAIPDQITDSIIFGYDPFEIEIFNALPEWIRNRIVTTPEYQAAIGNIETPQHEDQEQNDVFADADKVDDKPPF